MNFDDAPFFNQSFCLENVGFLDAEMQEVIEEFAYQKLLYRQVASAALKSILVKLARRFTVKEGQEKIDAVLDYVHTHYHQMIDSADVARAAGYHPVHVNRLVKRHTGLALKQYVIEYRMRQARHMLINTDKTVA